MTSESMSFSYRSRRALEVEIAAVNATNCKPVPPTEPFHDLGGSGVANRGTAVGPVGFQSDWRG